jgi:hypothetical protein
VDLPRDPGPLCGTGFAGSAPPFGSEGGADLAAHHGEVCLESAYFVSARGGQGKRVVAIGDRDGCPFQTVDSSYQRARGQDPEHHPNGHDGEQQGIEQQAAAR